MKRIGLLLLVVMMAFGVAGCSKDKDADPVGSWIISYDWGCNGTAGTAVWHIFVGGSFNDSEGTFGTWAVDKKEITLRYTSGFTYSGDVDDDRMSGTMIASATAQTGCWTATRTSTSP